MYKIDKIKGLFDCDICNNLLVDPISLPCGNNVCNQHLEHFVLEKSFVCESCNGKHHVPEEGHFIVNKQIKKALDIDLNNLKVSFSAYNECKVRIEEAKESLEQIEALERNAESHIYEYFGSIKRQVDIRREKLKAEIDDYSDSLIKSLDTAQTEFIRLSNEENELSKNIKAFKKQLDEITGKFDKLEFDDKKFKSMKQSLDVLNKNLIQTIYSYNDNLIDNKNYDFVFEQKAISSIFGRLFEV